MINEIKNHIQSLRDLYTFMALLQVLIDNSQNLDSVCDSLTDYLMIVERTAEFLSRVLILLNTVEIEGNKNGME